MTVRTYVLVGEKEEDGELLTLQDINGGSGFLNSNFMAVVLFISYLVLGKYSAQYLYVLHYMDPQ